MALTLIQTITVGAGGSSSIDFTGIPNTFTDLQIVLSARSANTVDYISLKFNGATTTFSQRGISGTGGSAYSGSRSDNLITAVTNSSGQTANTFSNATIYIPNYAGSTNKSFSADMVLEDNGSSYYVLQTLAGLWSNTAAITSISLTHPSSTFVQGSTASLYGVKADTILAQPKATGGNISLVNGYWVHTFTASGAFTPTTNLTNVEYLVIAGGGAGGYGAPPGGGGAGGYRSSVVGETSGGGASVEARLSLTSGTAYTVTIGAGGAATTSDTSRNSGSNSAFSTITATGGGGGGTQNSATPATYNSGLTGGSGGGASLYQAGTSNPGSGTASQGYSGGNDNGSSISGGGGGAGGVGNTNGVGGAGLVSSITGIATYRAGGGAGSTSGGGASNSGGSGGGGASASGSSAAVAGAVNTGSGGGAGNAGGGANGAAGGSGIVIVRYAA